MTHALELSHSFFKETSVAGKYGKKCQDCSVHRRKFSTAQSLIAAFWIKIWFEKRATTKPSLLHTDYYQLPLAPKDRRCYCDSKHLIFPKLQKKWHSQRGRCGNGAEAASPCRCVLVLSCQAQCRVSFTTLPPPPLNNSPVIFWICDAWLKELVTSHSIGWSRVAKPSCTSAVILVDTLPLPGRLQTHGSFPSR